jgi:hypothetical protein
MVRVATLLIYSQGILISARILISAADYCSKKRVLGMKISKFFFWIVKILYFVIWNREKKLDIFVSRFVFLPTAKIFHFFRGFLARRCGGGDGFKF